MSKYEGKAIAFTRPKRAELREGVKFPQSDGDELIVIRTQYSTISRGTELDLYTGQMHARGERAQWYPILPGYLPCGEVIEVGPKIKHLKVGDIAIGSNLYRDYDERYCCAWAGHCEYWVWTRKSDPWNDPDRVIKVPDGIEPKHAALAVLGGIAKKGIDLKVLPKSGETVLVVGMGAIGNFAAQICKLAGARVIAADLEESRLDIARKCGIEETINASTTPLGERVAELTDGLGPDAAIDVTGETEVLKQLIPIVKHTGRLHAQGMYLTELCLYFPETLFRRNLTLSATCGEGIEYVNDVLKLMAEARLTYRPLLSDVVPVGSATETYQRVNDHPDEVMTVAFQWPQ
jgi:2-desacetyl-2-hydroxyethyl bacteriochlorophyllide A dehydrogenase